MFIIYFIILTIFTIYLLLNTFVISDVYEIVDSSYVEDNNSNISEKTVTDNSYEDDNIKITINEYYEYNTKIYVADIILNSNNYLKTAFANNSYGKNVTNKTSTIANNNKAILAINGDYYGVRETGYVIRNGTIYRSTSKNNQEDLVIYQDGSFEIVNENNVSAEVLIRNGAKDVFSFGPSLVNNYEITVSENSEVGKSMASNPRTSIGIVEDNHYVMVVSDGRTSESAGLSLYELATFLKILGVKTAYNLDGGGSSTMYFNGSIINNPTTNGKKISERSVSDIVYIGY